MQYVCTFECLYMYITLFEYHRHHFAAADVMRCRRRLAGRLTD